jgi:flagellar basal-body rod protein FlgG
MTVQTLYTAATGMSALETKLDVVANNLANVETVGFKRGRANFEDLFYRYEMMPGAQDTAGNYTATGIAVGTGARVSSVQGNFVQGSFQPTGQQLDVMIEGDGFFQVTDPSGDTLYTRAGNFSRNANGQIVMGSANVGRLIQPPITIPEDATEIVVSAEGIVSVRRGCCDWERTSLRRPIPRARPCWGIPARTAWDCCGRAPWRLPTWSRSAS